jgi:hypothetical protein
MGRYAVVLLTVILLAPAARAEKASFTASVDRAEVGVGEQFRLIISISAENPDQVKNLKLPDTGGLQVVDRREEEALSFSFSTGGGQTYKKIKNIILVLRAKKLGKVKLSRASMVYKGKKYTTDPITIRVVQARPKPQRPRRRPFGFPSPFPDDDPFGSPFDDFFERRREEVSEDAIFVKAFVSPDVVVEGQQVTVTLAVYSQVGARIIAIRWPKLDDFFSVARDTSGFKTKQKVAGGELYMYKVIDQKALFPLRSGEIEIGPVEVEVGLSSSPFFPEESRTLRTRKARIKVIALPEEQQPESFVKGNVGSYQLTANLDANEVSLNQPVTYTLRIQGTGNIQRVRPPDLPELPRFKVFDPSVDVQVAKKGKYVKGSKTYEYILVPLASGELEIPSLEFSYYDPEDGEYRIQHTEPETIKVAASSAAGMVNGAAAGREVNILAGAFKPIRYQSRLTGYGAPFYRHSLFLPALVVPPSLYLLILIFGLVRARMGVDTRRSRMRKAWARGRRRLKAARQLAQSGKAEDFYAELKAALLDGVESRVGLPTAGLTMDELRERMQQAGMSAEIVEAVRTETENCDFGRFAPSTSRGDQMQASFERVRKLMRRLERERVRPVEEAR